MLVLSSANLEGTPLYVRTLTFIILWVQGGYVMPKVRINGTAKKRLEEITERANNQIGSETQKSMASQALLLGLNEYERKYLSKDDRDGN